MSTLKSYSQILENILKELFMHVYSQEMSPAKFHSQLLDKCAMCMPHMTPNTNKYQTSRGSTRTHTHTHTHTAHVSESHRDDGDGACDEGHEALGRGAADEQAVEHKVPQAQLHAAWRFSHFTLFSHWG